MNMAETSEQRYEFAKQLADDINAKAEELETAIYQALRQGGYHAKVKLTNAHAIGNGVFIGHGNHPLGIKATVVFDIGERGLS
jgi:hypothetical protein